MSENNNRLRPARQIRRARTRQVAREFSTQVESSVADHSDVRPDKVAKARQLIAKDAYPTTQVVRSLAEQIARFF